MMDYVCTRDAFCNHFLFRCGTLYTEADVTRGLGPLDDVQPTTRYLVPLDGRKRGVEQDGLLQGLLDDAERDIKGLKRTQMEPGVSHNIGVVIARAEQRLAGIREALK